MKFSSIRFGLPILLFTFAASLQIQADDTGMVKARLFEDSTGVYVLEVDIASQFLGFINQPKLPDRFLESQKTEITGNTNFVTARYYFSSIDKPLTNEDVIILDWNRRGVSFTAQWANGDYVIKFFNRGAKGFSIPVKEIVNETESISDLIIFHFMNGLKYPSKNLFIILFVLLLILFANRINSIKILISFFCGTALSLILIEIGVPGIPIGVVELLSFAAIFVTLLNLDKKENQFNFYSIYLILGILYGMGFGSALNELNIKMESILISSFFFQMGLLLSSFAIFWIGSSILKVLKLRNYGLKTEQIIIYAIGSIAVLFGLITFDNIQEDEIFYGLNIKETEEKEKILLPSALSEAASAISKPKPSTSLQYPVETFLTIEPFTVRYEVLINVSDMDLWYRTENKFKEVIDINEQESLIEDLLLSVNEFSSIQLEGKKVEPTFKRGDFVTISSTGIFTREAPIPEEFNKAVIGLRYHFKFDGLPNNVKFNWTQFNKEFSQLPITSADPFGGEKLILTQNDNNYKWKNKLKGYKIPSIEPVKVSPYPLPLISILILLFCSIYLLVNRIKGVQINGIIKRTLIGLIIIAFIIYPFIRFSVLLPIINNGNPNLKEAFPLTEGLLTNVYRSLDLRDEEEVYDRLALTVYGDQLTEIYLQSRKSMELENRGGARGKVDEVEILDVKSIENLGDDRIEIELIWKVSGSVTHFGHTHYRQNKNHAVMTITPIDEIWKVKNIDIIEETRLL